MQQLLNINCPLEKIQSFNIKSENNKELISHCLQNKEWAQKELYDLYSSNLYTICCRYAIDKNEAKDILQESFIKIFTHLHQYKSLGTLYGWMKKIIINTSLNFIKKNKRSIAKNIDDYEEKQFEDAEIIEKINTKDIMNCFMDLPYKYRIVLSMYIIEGYHQKEISEILNLEESTIRSRVFRGKTMLQKILITKYDLIEVIK